MAVKTRVASRAAAARAAASKARRASARSAVMISNSDALTLAVWMTSEGKHAIRATLRPKERWATPGVSLYRNWIRGISFDEPGSSTYEAKHDEQCEGYFACTSRATDG